MLNPYVLKAARKLLADAGISIGDRVTVRCVTTSALGEYEIRHTGVVSEIDDWIRVEGPPGYLHLPLIWLREAKVVPSGK